MPIILATPEAGGSWFEASLAKSEILSQKYSTQIRAGGVVQLVEHLLYKLEGP
jgi:hypothetical protein